MHIAGVLIASCFAATLSHPLDTIKTCMQGIGLADSYPTIKILVKINYKYFSVSLFNVGDVAQLKYKGIKATAASLSTEACCCLLVHSILFVVLPSVI